MRPAIAADGKSMCGTFARSGGAGMHLLAALTHDDGLMPARQQVPEGASEIAWFQPLLEVIAADPGVRLAVIPGPPTGPADAHTNPSGTTYPPSTRLSERPGRPRTDLLRL